MALKEAVDAWAPCDGVPGLSGAELEEAVAGEERFAEEQREIWAVAAVVQCGMGDAFGFWLGGDEVPATASARRLASRVG